MVMAMVFKNATLWLKSTGHRAFLGNCYGYCYRHGYSYGYSYSYGYGYSYSYTYGIRYVYG